MKVKFNGREIDCLDYSITDGWVEVRGTEDGKPYPSNKPDGPRERRYGVVELPATSFTADLDSED